MRARVISAVLPVALLAAVVGVAVAQDAHDAQTGSGTDAGAGVAAGPDAGAGDGPDAGAGAAADAGAGTPEARASRLATRGDVVPAQEALAHARRALAEAAARRARHDGPGAERALAIARAALSLGERELAAADAERARTEATGDRDGVRARVLAAQTALEAARRETVRLGGAP